MSEIRRPSGLKSLLAMLTINIVLGAPHSPSALASEAAMVVSIDASSVLATIEHGSVGVDIWFPNRRSVDREAVELYREAGVQAFGFDGGPVVDMYDWRSNTLRPWPNPDRVDENFGTTHGVMGTFEEVLQPKITFDDFGKLNRELGAVGRVHVNYGTGTPSEAAEWVSYAKTKGYNIKYWEIGQYLSGNGTLGFGNEPDAHEDKSAKGYARNALDFIAAMRDANPEIKIGIHLNGNLQAGSDERAWNEEVLSIVGDQIDFVDVWAYPFGSDVQVLQSTSALPDWLSQLRSILDEHGPRDRKLEIIIGETALDATGSPRNISLVAALFLPDQFLTLFEHGARRVDWFNGHLGPVPKFWYSWAWTKPELYQPENMVHPAEAQYGEYGLFSSGDCDSDTNICQPPAHTPWAAYYGLKMLQVFTSPGSQLLQVSSPDEFIGAHAVRRPDGSAAVLLINKHPTAVKEVRLDASRLDVRAGRAVLFYGKGSNGVACTNEGTMITEDILLPPYSLTALVAANTSSQGAVECRGLLEN